MSDKQTRSVTSDKLLSMFALICLCGGALVGIVLFIMSGTVNNRTDFEGFGENGFDVALLVYGLAFFLVSLFFYALLKGFADIVYLLKSQSRNQ